MKDDKDNIELSAVEDHDGILTIRGGGARRDWNGIHYKQGMSAKNVGATKLSANIATIPPGGVAYAHNHVGFEVILYILEGKVRHEFGPGLKQVLENEAGDFIYIKPGVPHEVFNVSDTEPVVAYFDGPGGTQVPRTVVEAMNDYLYRHNANTHWAYPSSEETDAIIDSARRVLANFLNASPTEIVFGANMTTLTFHLARALGRGYERDDEILVTELDHHANIAPWWTLEKECRVKVR